MSASYLRKYGAAFVKWEVAMKKHLRVVMEFTEENNMGMNNGRKNGERAFLDRFDQYEKICIQCHDNPDAPPVMRCGVFLKKREKKLLSSMVEQIRSKNQICY